MNDLVEHLIKRWVERTDPGQPDVTIDEVLMEMNEDNALKEALRTVAPKEEVLAKWKAKVNREAERSV
ncbi:hypothetical protein CDL60_27930 [Roseateles noduli]|nr:hypothetical protein CDL60_27930 [Roseateles noduli]